MELFELFACFLMDTENREKSEQMAKGKKPIHSHDKWLDSVNNNERHDMQRNKNTNLQQYNK